jgi:eukaryotic-like serine/threonine-protein kinase
LVASKPLLPGSRLERFEILSHTGAGGMGEVYRARNTELRREVAVKILPPLFSTDPDRLRRFRSEAQAAAALSHPNILFVFHVGQQDGGAPYMVTELLDGETLGERLRITSETARVLR